MTDLVPRIAEIARAILGEPNPRLSTHDQLRFGTNGSVAVEIGGTKRGSWWDHEAQEGGSPIDLIRLKAGIANGEISRWLTRELGIEPMRNGGDGAFKILARYPYRDEDGKLLFEVVRLEPKDFRQRRPDGPGKWIWETKSVRKVPYRLPELIAASADQWVFVVEGEKDVDILVRRGLVATTNPGGAAKVIPGKPTRSKWRPDYNRFFAGRRVCILPDNDDCGSAHASDVARNLAPVAADVRVVELTEVPEKGDVSDWLAAGGSAEALVRIADNAAAFDAARQKPHQANGEDHNAPGESGDTMPFTEQWLGLELVARYPGAMRYTAELGQWHLWDGNLWRRDAKLGIFTRAQGVCRDAARQAEEKQAKELLQAKARAAAVSLAREHPDAATAATEWNQNSWLAGTPRGTMDLRTGLLRPSDPADLISRSTRAVPAGDCPLWLATIKKIFGDDEEVIGFAQRLAGYCLTAEVSEEVLLFLWGPGGNGKGTFIETILYVMGDYATTIPINTLIETLHKEHPTEIAKLHTMRLVVASETDTNTRWNTARLKTLTGGDQLTGRWMRADFFDFMPTHKLIISGNNKPSFGKVDEAIRRRLVLWPFNVRFANPDKTLKVRLRAEAPAILAWMIRGCVEWRRSGLQVPAKLMTATEEYLAEADDVSRFIEECCVREEVSWIKTSTKELYIAWVKWCQDGGIPPGSQRDFTERMKERFEITRELTTRRT